MPRYHREDHAHGSIERRSADVAVRAHEDISTDAVRLESEHEVGAEVERAGVFDIQVAGTSGSR